MLVNAFDQQDEAFGSRQNVMFQFGQSFLLGDDHTLQSLLVGVACAFAREKQLEKICTLFPERLEWQTDGEVIVARVIVHQLANVSFENGLVRAPDAPKEDRLGEMPTPADDRQGAQRLFTENLRALDHFVLVSDPSCRATTTHSGESQTLGDDPAEQPIDFVTMVSQPQGVLSAHVIEIGGLNINENVGIRPTDETRELELQREGNTPLTTIDRRRSFLPGGK